MNLILFTFFVCAGIVYGQSLCKTPNDDIGDCISIFKCPSLIGLVNKKNKTNDELVHLKMSQCGFHGDAPAVCCPKSVEDRDITCTTPNGHSGKCISIYSCPHITKLLKPPASAENVAYVRKSICKGRDEYNVCCPDSSPSIVKVVGHSDCAAMMTAYPPDPRSKCCGYTAGGPSKLFGYGGIATHIDDHPWAVIIEYENKDGQMKLLCGGSLISGKYVLTAGHCVAGRILEKATPRIVRLGEYNINNEGLDCVEVEAGGLDCNDGVTRIAIEKTIPHPDYDPTNPHKRNDVGLIRLKETAAYTDFIRPICLPTIDLTKPENTLAPYVPLFAVGWGAVSEVQPYSDVKVKVQVPFVSMEKCQPAYNSSGLHIPLWKGQLCAGGKEGVDSCKGDSGGPLVYDNNKGMSEIIGLVSFGPTPCGLKGVPGIYSNIYLYLDWIKSVIVP